MTRLLRAVLAGLLLAAALPAVTARAAVDCDGPAGVAIDRFVPYENRFGETIAVDLYVPADAAGVPLTTKGCRYPVVLESSPYRDWITPQPTRTAQDEENQRAWWVMRGYVFAFADVPGTGGSDGTWCFWCRNEQLSGVDIVNALGAEPWSNGRVGMFGGSYRGINALLVAQHKPKHLKAVLAAAFLTDPYTDFFYIGGMPRGEDSTALMAAFTGLAKWTGQYEAPTTEQDVQRFADVWADRATAPPADFLNYPSDHPTRDAWYEERTVHPERVTVPTYMLGGWNDIFARATWSTYDRLASKTKILVQGPFVHVPLFVQANAWPCESKGIDFCGEPFFARQLKGEGSAAYDAMVDKPVRSYIGPNGNTAEAPYIASAGKPKTNRWYLNLGKPGTTATVGYNPGAGITSGRWFLRGSVPGGQMPFDTYLGVDGPSDQRIEEARGVSLASPPLEQPVTVLGKGLASLVASANAPDADVVVRIVDEYPVGDATFPAGHNTLVATGWLRASHRRGHTADRIAPLVPGEAERLLVEIWPTGYRFAEGHRIRVDLYPADTPRFMPQTDPFDLTVDLGASRLQLETLENVPAVDLG